jgi:hypothetical protein
MDLSGIAEFPCVLTSFDRIAQPPRFQQRL